MICTVKPIYINILIFIAIAVLICTAIVVYQIIEDKRNKPRAVTTNHLREMYMIINTYVNEKGKVPPQSEFMKIVKEYGGEDAIFKDFWEMPIIYRIEDDLKFTLYSYGPNKKDDNQKLDDIVCLSTGQVLR